MVHQVKIPPAGESITSATVAQWHVADGERVKRGDPLATIETDKVSNELEAEADGTLRVLVKEGEEVGIGVVIAEIDDGGDEGGGEPDEEAGAEEPPPEVEVEEQEPEEVPVAGEEQARVFEIKVPAAGESITTATVAQWHKRDGETVGRGETLVTLETDKVSNELEAEMEGVLQIITPEGAEVEIGTLIGKVFAEGVVEPVPERDIAPVADQGSAGVPEPPGEASREDGPAPQQSKSEAAGVRSAPVLEVGDRGEKDARDEARAPADGETRETDAGGTPVLPLKPDLTVVAAPPQKEELPQERDGRTTRRRMSQMRRKIATQLVSIQQNAAILTTFNEADMSAVMRLRKQVQEDFVAKHGVKLGFMSFFVKAVVQALKEVPALNSRIDGDELVENHFWDVGVAVGTDKGLVVPVIRDADQKSFAEIELDILGYATKAREGKIQLEDMRGGCFTISNGGVYGSLLSTPILNPPQSGILGMHTIQQRPMAVDGEVVIRPMMYLALSYDHRVVDGKGAVTFLIRVKEAIENPTRLLLEI